MTPQAPLYQQTCEPCREGAPKLSPEQIQEFHAGAPGWKLVEVDGIARLRRAFPFESIAALLHFQAKVMEEADAQGHHPLVIVSPTRNGWRVLLDLWTHKIHGLHANDFIMASRFDLITGEGGTGDAP